MKGSSWSYLVHSILILGIVPLLLCSPIHAKTAHDTETNPVDEEIRIKQAVEELFNVRVLKVTTAVYRGKPKVVMNRSGRFVGRGPNWKKAYVTLAEGDSIDVFDVV